MPSASKRAKAASFADGASAADAASGRRSDGMVRDVPVMTLSELVNSLQAIDIGALVAGTGDFLTHCLVDGSSHPDT